MSNVLRGAMAREGFRPARLSPLCVGGAAWGEECYPCICTKVLPMFPNAHRIRGPLPNSPPASRGEDRSAVAPPWERRLPAGIRAQRDRCRPPSRQQAPVTGASAAVLPPLLAGEGGEGVPLDQRPCANARCSHRWTPSLTLPREQGRGQVSPSPKPRDCRNRPPRLPPGPPNRTQLPFPGSAGFQPAFARSATGVSICAADAHQPSALACDERRLSQAPGLPEQARVPPTRASQPHAVALPWDRQLQLAFARSATWRTGAGQEPPAAPHGRC